MRLPIEIKDGNEKLCSHSGLNLIGQLIECTQLKERLEVISGVHCVNPDFSHYEVLCSMLGLISIGKPKYDAIEIFRMKPEFFTNALRLSGCPSSVTLRQRIDLIGSSADPIIKQESAGLVLAKAPGLTPVQTGVGSWIPLDMDVSPFDNSKTQKEGVSRTYKGCDGFAPMLAYIGGEGYLVNVELREGSQHCQRNTPQFIKETLKLARIITSAPILMRLDSGNDSKDNFPDPKRFPEVDFIIKRNLRKESRFSWLELAKNKGELIIDNSRKKVWLGKTDISIKGEQLPYPIIFQVTERYMHKKQVLLIPEIEIETYWCSIRELDSREVISLYHDHGTSEQFHSEIKSDMGVERLPSGNFKSNSLILHITMLSYNILRIIGQHWVEEDNNSDFQPPVARKKKVRRRRIRTVMQDLIYMAGRLIKSGRKLFLSFGQLNSFADLFQRISQRIESALHAI